MPPQSRLTDMANVPADAHGCPLCPHPATGPAIAGSPNVLVNSLPALRVGDRGVHIACCDGNTWAPTKGSSSVLINNIPAVRLGDTTGHCGGVGQMIGGSPTVMTGG
jgi:uncharacterized Zn-binding protein involved in type VI secretion